MADTDFDFGHNNEEPKQDATCGATIECPHCRAFHGYCSDLAIALATARGEQMLPSSEGQSGEPRRRRTGGMVYLTNEMLSTKTPTAARILAVKADDDNRFGARVVLKMVLEGNTVYWGVNIKKNPNYKLFEKEFGHEENDWVGKDIFLVLEKDEFSESYFARVSFDANGKKAGRSR